MLWKIHNKYYDLTKYLDLHPGGRKHLEYSNGIDATAAFESCHTFSNMSRIKSIMQKYEINEENIKFKDVIPSTKYTFSEKGFYHELQTEVRVHMKKRNKKWTYSWLFLLLMIFSIFCFTFIYAFLGTQQLFIYRFIASIISGTSLVMTLLQGLHDASHFAISNSKTINRVVSCFLSGLGLWDWSTWIKHHCIYHHSFTGDYNLDPDMRHTHPFFKKHYKSQANLINNPSYISLVMSLFPGMYFGQCLAYIVAQIRGKLWGLRINFVKTKVELVIYIVQVLAMIYGGSIILVSSFIISLNIVYSIAILPDHDQLETRLNGKDTVTDWGEIQVRHAGNFANLNIIYTRLNGSMNYQIEHHLFPTLNSYHLPEISKIVKKLCKKYDIKYTHNPSIVDAYLSVIENFALINNNEK